MSRKGLHRMWILVSIIALPYLGFGLFLFLFQGSLLYQPNFPAPSDFNSCEAFAPEERVNLNGTRAYYKYISDKFVVLYHGNAGSACHRSFFKTEFERLGYSYIFVEYAGYAGDTRAASQKLIFEDVENVNSFILTLNPSRLVLIAESIGSGAAAYHVSLNPESEILLLAPFDTLANLVRTHYPIYPVAIFLKEKYDNVQLAQSVKRALIIHGTQDEVIPIERGETLFGALLTANKKFIEIPGASHNSLYDYPQVFLEIREFLGTR